MISYERPDDRTQCVTLSNEYYRIEIDQAHGVINRILDVVGGYDLITEPRLADNFRLLLPLPKMQANYIYGRDQQLTSVEQTKSGMKLHWSGPLRNEQGSFELAVTMRVEFVGEAIHFRCDVENHTEHKVAEVWYPVIGGMTGLGENPSRTEVLVPTRYSQWNRDLFHTFGTGEGLGVDGGEHVFNYPGVMSMSWTSLYHPELKRGVYFATHDTVPRCKLLRFSLRPGTAFQRVDGDWPKPEEVGMVAIGASMSWLMVPYTNPGETYSGPTVVLQGHDGGWKESAKMYRAWFEKEFGVVDSRESWIRQKTATLDTMFMLPEDNISLTYADIPAWAKSAKDNGVTAVLISGWQIGGHDRGYPYYEPDPRLGTWEELEAGIRACHDMGLRVYFFVNMHPMDVTTEWYEKELHKYRILDPWGYEYYHFGFGMGTVSARRCMTDVGLATASPAIPEVRDIFVRQMRKLAEIGADGVHIDKLVFNGLDFNPLSNCSPDQAVWWGALQTIKEMLAECRAVNPEFTFSYEGIYDRLMSYADVMWWAPQEHSVMKIVFPEWTPHVSVTQPCAYNTVNMAVVRAQNLLVGPRNYQSGMDYPPMAEFSKYIGEITRIRESMVDVVSYGEILDTSEPLFAADTPLVQLDGELASSPHVHWTLYRSVRTGKRCIVLANLGRTPVTGKVQSASDSFGRCRLRQAFEQDQQIYLPASITIPAERVVFLAEE